MSTATSAAQFAILRVKRKRTDDVVPLDAFVVNSHSPKRVKRDGQSAAAGVFRFAQTVPADAFESDESARMLRTQIKDMISGSPVEPATFGPPVPSAPAAPAQSAASTSAVPPKYRFAPVRNRVRDPRESERPPTVRPSGEAFQEDSSFEFYEAYAENDENMASGRTKPKIIRSNKETEEEKKQMDAFLPMLESYLSLNDVAPNSHSPPKSHPLASDLAPPQAADEEYVYDVYYRDLNPAQSANDVGSLDGLKRIGQLAALDEDELLPDNVSSEEEDEADEDSNDENYYKHDYPDSDDDSDDDL